MGNRIICSYNNTSVGRLGVQKMNCNKGDVCKFFAARLFNIPTGASDTGSDVSNSNRAVVSGGVWLNKPTRFDDRPSYVSTNSLNVASLQTSLGVSADTPIGPGQSGYIKFEFNSTTGASNNYLWIGFWVENYSNYPNSEWFGYVSTKSSATEWYVAGSGRVNGETIPIGTEKANNSGWRRFLFNFDTGAIAPGINKPTILITNWSPIVNHNTNDSAFITWNKVTNQASTVKAFANGQNTGTWGPTPQNANAGDESNTSRKKPADVSVGSGAQFVYKATRSNALSSSLNDNEKRAAEDQVTLYTYTYPSLGDFKYVSPAFTVQNNIINANHNLSLSWTSNKPVNHNKSTQPANKGAGAKSTSDQHKTQLKMKNTVTTDMNETTNSPSTSVNIPWSNIMKYVPFDSTKTTGETVTLTLTKTHAQDGDITKAELTKQLTVRYIPTEIPSWPAAPQTGFNLNSATGTILQTNSVVDKDPNNSIWVSFTYPAGEYGIIDGYRVRVKSQDGTWFGPYWYNTDRANPKLNPSVRIPTQDIKFGMQNEVYIEAFYKHDDGQRYYGPTLKKGFPSVITKLTTPTIIYPTNASEWINKNYRILFSLPHDGDWGDYTDTIKNTYKYRDIQVKINNTVTYSFINNPEIFSITPLSPHESKIVINPSLMSTYPNATTYTFQVRVRKNYGYLDSQEEASWSLWSAARVVNVKPASFNVNKGDYIMASHYNLLKPLMTRMRNTYPTYDVTTTTVNVGDYIEAEGFIAPYKDILQCFNTVNGWGTYHASRSSVKFNKGVNIPKFEPVVGEYITAARQDKIYNLSPGTYDGRNYIGIMFDDANLCK